MRALCYVHHRGVGHYVRMHTIAAELAVHHETILVDAGEPIPRPHLDAEPRSLPGAEAVDGIAELRPDVVLIEHYPFSKWELETEVESLIVAARRANPRVRVASSLRDIPPRTRHLEHTPDYDEQVLARLARAFDAVVVHTDPCVLGWEDHFPAADRLPCPWYPTGVVVGPPARAIVDGRACVVATAHGPDATPLLLATIDACSMLAAERHGAAAYLHVFAAFGASDAELATLHTAARRMPGEVVVHEFTPDYTRHLAGATVSVSRGGYNTLAEVARHQVHAVVVPEPRTDDQVPRAAAFARAGACEVVDGPVPEPRALADAIARAHDRGRPTPTIDLTGAATTRRILESLAAQ